MRSSLRTVVLALCAPAALLGGCSQEGTSPTCVNNVTKDGILIYDENDELIESPCVSYGQCLGTYDGTLLGDRDGEFATPMACTTTAANEGRCSSDGPVPAIECCCPSFSRIDGRGNDDPSDDALVEFRVVKGACVNQTTGETVTADDKGMRQCLYGFGEVDLEAGNNSGGAGGGGNHAGGGGSGGSGGGP